MIVHGKMYVYGHAFPIEMYHHTTCPVCEYHYSPLSSCSKCGFSNQPEKMKRVDVLPDSVRVEQTGEAT